MSDCGQVEMLTGIEAIAWGLLDGGVEFTTAYPGFHAHELAELLACPGYSVNEKNAMAMAWGASLAGVPSATIFKNVGLNDAADPFINAAAVGVNAGLVVVILDDYDVEQSQIRQDSRSYADFFPLLWLEPSSVEQAYHLAREAPALSEQLGAPVVLRVTNLLCHGTAPVLRKARSTLRRPFQRDPERWVVHPLNVAAQEERQSGRREAIAAWVDTQYPRPQALGPPELRVVVGMSAAAMAGAPPHLVIFTLPLPRPWLAAFAQTDAAIHVQEHGASYVSAKIAAELGSLRVDGSSVRAPGAVQAYRITERYESLYAVLRRVDRRVIIGDLGGHTMDTPRSVDACLCYGCAVGVASGVAEADPTRSVFCVTGDAAFLHSGKSALMEAVVRRSPVTVIILDNDGSQGTGGQRVPGSCEVGLPDMPWEELNFADVSSGRFEALLNRFGDHRGPRVARIRTPF